MFSLKPKKTNPCSWHITPILSSCFFPKLLSTTTTRNPRNTKKTTQKRIGTRKTQQTYRIPYPFQTHETNPSTSLSKAWTKTDSTHSGTQVINFPIKVGLKTIVTTGVSHNSKKVGFEGSHLASNGSTKKFQSLKNTFTNIWGSASDANAFQVTEGNWREFLPCAHRFFFFRCCGLAKNPKH